MHAKFGTNYHWIPELYRRLKLPVFDGVQEALDKHSAQRKRVLEKAKSTPAKKRRIAWKVKRTLARKDRINWTKKHGRDTYGCDDGSDLEHDLDIVKEGRKGKTQGKGKTQRCVACGSSTHQRSSHKDCPFKRYKGSSARAKRGDKSETAMPLHEGEPEADKESSLSGVQGSDASSDVSCLDDSLSDVLFR